MSPGSRCDEILRMIDEVLGDPAGAEVAGGPTGRDTPVADPAEPRVPVSVAR